MKWTDVEDSFPEDSIEVLCAVTKFGRRIKDKSYDEVVVDEDGKKWRRVGEQVEYVLLWREDGKWVHWEIDNYEDYTAHYKFVVAWQNIDEYKLKEDETNTK